MNIREQLGILARFTFAPELTSFPLDKTGALEYYYHNDNFGPGDADYLYRVIRLYRPKRIVEIGSGYSTLVAINALKQNRKEDPSYNCEHVCIEPYEIAWLERTGVTVISEKGRKRRQETIQKPGKI